MGNEVEARTQRVRNHLQRPDHSDWQLTNARIRSTVYLTAPPRALMPIDGYSLLSMKSLVVCLRFDLVEGGSAALDFGDDVLCGGFPDEGFGVGVPVRGPRGDGLGEFGDAGEDPSAQAFVGEFLEPAFDQIHPRT